MMTEPTRVAVTTVLRYVADVLDEIGKNPGNVSLLGFTAVALGRVLHINDMEGHPVVDRRDIETRALKAFDLPKGSSKAIRAEALAELRDAMRSGEGSPIEWVIAPKVTSDERELESRVRKLDLDEQAKAVLKARKAADRPRLADSLLTAADIDALADPEYLVDGVLNKDSLALLVGASGVGKSLVALALALSVATGRPWLGHNVRKGRVLYLASEGRAGLKGRKAAWMAGLKTQIERDAFLVYSGPIDLSSDTFVDELVEVVANRRIDYVIDDTLNRSLGGLEENSATAMSVVVAALDRVRLANPGACVLVVHHSGVQGDRPRGSTALYGAMDTVLTLTGDSGSIKLENTKDKDGSGGIIEHLGLRPVEGTGSVVVDRRAAAGWASPVVNLSAKLEESLAHITRAFSETGASKTDIVGVLVEWSGIGKSTAYEHINALTSSKRLALSGSRYTVTTTPKGDQS